MRQICFECGLIRRAGTKPRTSKPIPHAQLDQTAPVALQNALVERALTLDGVSLGRSFVSLPDSRAFLLDVPARRGPAETFMGPGEFAHIHGRCDGSLHMTLPEDARAQVYDAGWGEPHPFAGVQIPAANAMIYGPRDAAELEIVWNLLRLSHAYACAAAPAP